MKNTKKSLMLLIAPVLVLLISMTFNSCSKDNDSTPNYVCETCATTPDALAENDASAKGIYKGIVVGSTGTLSINIQNGSSTITGTMVLDGTSVALTSSVTYVSGQPYVAPFTGTYNGSPITINFSVGLSGGSPTVTSSDIPGHPNASFTLYKETSTSLIEAFEGSFTKTGGGTGVFNILLSRALNKWGGIALIGATGTTDSFDGTINTNNQLIVNNGNGTIFGTLSGDVMNGSFQDGNGATITTTAHRTL